MGPRGRRTAVGATVLALSSLLAGGVVAATQSSDEAALRPSRQPADRSIERDVDRLLSRMTLQEKLQQIQLLPDFKIGDATDPAREVRNGLGSILSVTDPAQIREFQRVAVEETRLKIPLLFAFDTIHGFRTVFPIPLGTGASFDPRSRPTTRRSAHASRPRSGSSRPTPRWSTCRTSRAGAASPRRPARTRT